MVDERESPSAGWREVYHEMDADTEIEEPTHPCPDCGRTCQHVARDVYDCAEHGLFRASGETTGPASDAAAAASDASESSESAKPAEADGGTRSDADRSADENDSPDADDETGRARWSAGPV